MNTPAHRRGGGGPLESRRRSPWEPWGKDPLEEFQSLWRDMGRLLERGSGPAWGGGVAWVPAVEEDETDDAYEVRAELPGIPRENISVEIDEHELRISGELDEEQRERVLTRRSGRFFYRTPLPAGTDPARAEADLTDGILLIRLPKAEPPQRRRLTIGGQD